MGWASLREKTVEAISCFLPAVMTGLPTFCSPGLTAPSHTRAWVHSFTQPHIEHVYLHPVTNLLPPSTIHRLQRFPGSWTRHHRIAITTNQSLQANTCKRPSWHKTQPFQYQRMASKVWGFPPNSYYGHKKPENGSKMNVHNAVCHELWRRGQTPFSSGRTRGHVLSLLVADRDLKC